MYFFRYVSCVVGCPYEDLIKPTKVAEVRLLAIWWLVRVSLVVAFCPKILGGGGDPRIILLSFYGCRLSGGDTMRW